MTRPVCGEREAEPEPRGAALATVIPSDGAFAAPDTPAAAGVAPQIRPAQPRPLAEAVCVGP